MGGHQGTPIVPRAQVYAASSWSATGVMNVARSSHTATLLANGTVLVAGGTTAQGVATTSAEIYTP